MGRIRTTQGAAGPKHLPSKDAVRAGAFDLENPPPLGYDGLEWWHWAVAALQSMGILDSADSAHLRLCAETYQDYCDAREDILALGRLMAQSLPSGDTTYRRNPAMVTMENARNTLRSFYSDLGLTPSARAKFGGGQEKEVDPFAELLARKSN